MTPWTRQNAGRLSNGFRAAADGGGVGLKAPAGTTWAAVIVVAGNFRAAMLSHVAANTGVVTKKALTNTAPRTILMWSPLRVRTMTSVLADQGR
jgi:hypothetical protein